MRRGLQVCQVTQEARGRLVQKVRQVTRANLAPQGRRVQQERADQRELLVRKGLLESLASLVIKASKAKLASKALEDHEEAAAVVPPAQRDRQDHKVSKDRQGSSPLSA